MSVKLLCTAILAVTLISCSPSTRDLKPVQQVKAGDYTITILSETGLIKQGANNFNLEFRKTADNQLVDVGKVEVSPIMEMAGMSPMMATAEVTTTETAGRYKVAGNFTMAGLWRCQVRFGDGQSVRFNLNAQ